MALPTYEQLMLPILKFMSDGQTRKSREIVTAMFDCHDLTEEERVQVTATGTNTFKDRTSWAISYLFNAGALTRPRRATYIITACGHQLIEAFPHGLTKKTLVSFTTQHIQPTEITNGSTITSDIPIATYPDGVPSDVDAQHTPHERIEQAIAEFAAITRKSLLSELKNSDPLYFEKIVLDLMVAMGYTGAMGIARTTKASHDGGIDGVIDQDALGLDKIYLQAKRYNDTTIGTKLINEFIGALEGKHASQGVFLTTSQFSRGAVERAQHARSRVVLVDGDTLVDLMMRYRVGVQVKEKFEILEVDQDYFEPIDR